MNFDFTEEQEAVSELAGQILGEMLTHERLKEIEAAPVRFAGAEWKALAEAGLIGIALPEADGGAGLGIFEACRVLEQIGRTVAPVPYLATVVLGALPIAAFGSEPLRAAWLPGVIDGSVLLSAGLFEAGSRGVPVSPTTSATQSGDGWTLSGAKRLVPWGAQANAILVPAATGTDESTVFVVRTDAAGISVDPQITTNGEPQAQIRFESVALTHDDVLGTVGDGESIATWIDQRGTAAVCASAAGVCSRAVELIGSYTSERKQFDAPLATFQAVAHRAADAYIDATAVRFTAWQAAWSLSEGLDAADALDVAKFWAAEGGQRVVHAAQHLHGGIGVDKDYPLHRYFLWAKLLELSHGSATDHLRSLGARIAN